MSNAHSAHAHSNIDLGARARGKQSTNKRMPDKKMLPMFGHMVFMFDATKRRASNRAGFNGSISMDLNFQVSHFKHVYLPGFGLHRIKKRRINTE